MAEGTACMMAAIEEIKASARAFLFDGNVLPKVYRGTGGAQVAEEHH